MNDSATLTNIEFDFPFAGKTYKIKKATLRQVMDFRRKVSTITDEKDAAGDLRIVVYAIYLILHGVDETVTEDFILDNASPDINIIGTMNDLGFLNQQKAKVLNRIQDALGTKPTGDESSES